MRSAAQTEVAARERVNEAKSAFGPKLSVRIDANVAPIAPYIENQYDRSVTGSLVLRQPIFSSGLNRSRVREAADRDVRATLETEAARRGVVQLVTQAWSQLVATRSAVAVQARQVEVQRAAVVGNRIEERVGTADDD